MCKYYHSNYRQIHKPRLDRVNLDINKTQYMLMGLLGTVSQEVTS